MSVATISEQITIAGLSFGSLITRTLEGSIAQDVDLAAGVSGTLTTRTDADTGVITMAEGHGITDSDKVDVHWDDAGGLHKVAYDFTVTAYDSTTISIDLGSGEDLPAQDYTVVACIRQTIDCDFDGDLLTAEGMIVIGCDRDAHVEFQENNDTHIHPQPIDAGESWRWLSRQGVTNPLTGNPVGKIMFSNGSETAGTLRIGVLYDSVS